MMTLYDEEKIMRTWENRIRREEREKERNKEREKGIRSLIEMCQKMNGTISDVIENLISVYGLSKEESYLWVQKYWK